MAFAVFHIMKQKGDGGGLTAHIDRLKMDETGKLQTFRPASVRYDERTHLNKDYLLADGETRSMAIARRIKDAGIKRAIRDDQVKAFSVVCTSDHDKMVEIERAGRLDEWATDCIAAIKRLYGERNVVAAALHMDEKTPHLHVTVVPITEDETKKRVQRVPEGEEPKKKRRYKKQGGARLCAADVLTPKAFEIAQEVFGKAMTKWGMERGIVGSKAKHQAPAEYNLEQVVEETKAMKRQRDTATAERDHLTSEVQQLEREKRSLSTRKAITEGICGVFGLSSKDKTIKALESEKVDLMAQRDAAIKERDKAKAGAKDAIDKAVQSVVDRIFKVIHPNNFKTHSNAEFIVKEVKELKEREEGWYYRAQEYKGKVEKLERQLDQGDERQMHR